MTATTPTTKVKGMGHDLMWTALTSAGVLVGNIVLSSQLAHRGAVAVFEPYNLAKRYGAGFLPFLTLGLTLGVVKMVASVKAEEDKSRYHTASMLLTLAMLAAGTLLIAAAPDLVSQALLGTSDIRLTWAIWAYSVAMVLDSLVYSFFRARLRQTRANWSSILAMVATPVSVVAFAPQSWVAADMLFTTSAIVAVFHAAQFVEFVVRGIHWRPDFAALKRSIRDLLTYSIPRVPAGVCTGLLMLVGPWVARRAGATLASGFLLAGMTVARIGGASLQSFSVVLLPRVSEMHADGRSEVIGTITARLIAMVVCLSAIAVPLLYAVAGDLVSLWLGPEFEAGTGVIRTVILAVPALLAYYVLISVTDGAIRRPVNTYATALGLAVAVGLSFAVEPTDGMALALAYVAGQWLAGGLVAAVLTYRFKVRLPLVYIGSMAAAGVLAGFGLHAAGSLGLAGTTGELARLGLAGVVILAGIAGGLWFAPADLGFRRLLMKAVKLGRA